MKPCRFGQDTICETPFYDSEIVYFPSAYNYNGTLKCAEANNNCVNGLTTWLGPLGMDKNYIKEASCPISKIIGQKAHRNVTACFSSKESSEIVSVYQDYVGVCSAPNKPEAGYYANSWEDTGICTMKDKPPNTSVKGFSGIWTNEKTPELINYYTTGDGSAHKFICKYLRNIDISQCLDLYLKWGIVPAFNDRSTPTIYGTDDCEQGNKNHTYWNASPLNIEYQCMNEISSDIPAQNARMYYAPPESNRTNYCSQCPDVAVANVTEDKFKGQDYINATAPYRGIAFRNQGYGEGKSSGCVVGSPEWNTHTLYPGKTPIANPKKGVSSNIVPVYPNNSSLGGNDGTCPSIFTSWGRRGSYGDFNFLIPSQGNEFMDVVDAVSMTNKSAMSCHDIDGIVDT